MKKHIFILYLLLCVLLIISDELTKHILSFQKLLIMSLSEQLTFKQIEKYIHFQEKWTWVTYIFIPIFILIKTILIANILYIGIFFYSKEKVTFIQLWNVTIKGEFIFLIVGVLKIIWFYFFQTNYNLEDLQYFYPLSALNIIGYKGLETYFIYPFQVLNLFELFYILLLGFYVGKLTYTTKEKGKSMDFGLKIVASSYVPALFLWVALVMFFTLNNS